MCVCVYAQLSCVVLALSAVVVSYPCVQRGHLGVPTSLLAQWNVRGTTTPPPTHIHTPHQHYHTSFATCAVYYTHGPTHTTSLTPHIPHPSHPSPLTSLIPHIPHPSHPSLTLDNCTLFTLNPSSPHPFTPSTPSPLTHPHTLTVSPVCAFCSGTSKVVCPPPPK